MTESYTKEMINKMNVNYMLIRRYKDHISIIYPFDIVEIYEDKIILTRISYLDGTITTTYLHPFDTVYINDIISKDNAIYIAHSEKQI